MSQVLSGPSTALPRSDTAPNSRRRQGPFSVSIGRPGPQLESPLGASAYDVQLRRDVTEGW
jgi:hypothetical protein